MSDWLTLLRWHRAMRSSRTRTEEERTVDGCVLVTGAAGRVGTAIRPFFSKWWRDVRLTDRVPITTLASNEQFVAADICEGELEHLVRGVDAVVHLAAVPSEAPLEALWRVNVSAFEKLLCACVAQAVTSVTFASTMHVMGGYRRDERFDTNSAPRPDCRYAVSKLAAEGLAALFAQRAAMRIGVARIGSHQEKREDSEPGNWIGSEDLARLLHALVVREQPGFVVAHGVTVHAGLDIGQEALERTLGFRFLHHGPSIRDELAKAERWYHDKPLERDHRGGEFLSYPL